ncbi:unnamed protein product, partial [Prorocentrum cordatum]
EHAGGRPGGRRDPALDGAAEALAARRTSQGALGALRRTLLAGPRGAPLSAVARCAGTARRLVGDVAAAESTPLPAPSRARRGCRRGRLPRRASCPLPPRTWPGRRSRPSGCLRAAPAS